MIAWRSTHNTPRVAFWRGVSIRFLLSLGATATVILCSQQLFACLYTASSTEYIWTHVAVALGDLFTHSKSPSEVRNPNAFFASPTLLLLDAFLPRFFTLQIQYSTQLQCALGAPTRRPRFYIWSNSNVPAPSSPIQLILAQDARPAIEQNT